MQININIKKLITQQNINLTEEKINKSESQ